MRDHKMLIPRLDLKRLGLFAWCDAANKNRVDGTSTQGYFIGASHQNMLKGDCEVVAPWHGTPRKYKGSAEAPVPQKRQLPLTLRMHCTLLDSRWLKCSELVSAFDM